MKVVTTDGVAIDQLTKELGEPRALPTGRAEFEEWAERVLSGVTFTADKRSLRFALAQMLMQIGPVEAFKPDGYFIKALHVAATKQVAFEIGNELKIQAQKEIEADKAKQTIEAAIAKRARKGKKYKQVATQDDVATNQ